MFIKDSPGHVLSCAGPCPAYLLAFLIKGGKTQADGRARYAGSLRHAVPELCPQAALGQHIFGMYTLENVEFPDARDPTRWNSAPMWPGHDPSQNVTYSQQCKAINKYLRDDLKIFVRKATHIFRALGARALDERGVDNAVSSPYSTGSECFHTGSECLHTKS